MAEGTRPLTTRQQRAQYKVMAAISDLQAGRPAEARPKLEEALDLDHEFVEARLWLAHVLVNEGEAQAALQQYRTGLLFSPAEARLQEGLRAAQVVAKEAAAPGGRDRLLAKKRLVPNLILAALIPPSGIVLGLWEVLLGQTEEWKDLGLKTLLVAVAALFAWAIVLAFVSVVAGGMQPAPGG